MKQAKMTQYGWTHKHAPRCEHNFWFCCMMEGWAKGKYPVKEEILKEIAEAETFINQCSDNDIHHYRLICVPWKDVSPYDNTPPRIGLNKNGAAEWIYGGENDGKSVGPLSLKDPDAYGVAEPNTTSHSVTKMAAYVKGTMVVGKKVYSECMRVANRKRKLDRQWEQKAAEWSVENEVFHGCEPELYKKRRIDDEWQARMDQWEHEKRQCQLHFEAWRKVKGVGVGAVGESVEHDEIEDEDSDNNNGGDNYNNGANNAAN